jgi:hypothetical protein
MTNVGWNLWNIMDRDAITYFHTIVASPIHDLVSITHNPVINCECRGRGKHFVGENGVSVWILGSVDAKVKIW